MHAPPSTPGASLALREHASSHVDVPVVRVLQLHSNRPKASLRQPLLELHLQSKNASVQGPSPKEP